MLRPGRRSGFALCIKTRLGQKIPTGRAPFAHSFVAPRPVKHRRTKKYAFAPQGLRFALCNKTRLGQKQREVKPGCLDSGFRRNDGIKLRSEETLTLTRLSPCDYNVITWKRMGAMFNED